MASCAEAWSPDSENKVPTIRNFTVTGAVLLIAGTTVLANSGFAGSRSNTTLLGSSFQVSKSTGTATVTNALPVSTPGAHLLRLRLSEPYRSSSGTPAFEVLAEDHAVVDRPVMAPGTPNPPFGASFPEPTCTRSYVVPGLVESATAGDNRSALNAALASAVSGDCLSLPPGTYRRSGNIDVPSFVSGITLRGAGRGQTVLLGTNAEAHGFRVLGARNFRLQDLTIDTVSLSGRTGLNQQGHSTLLLDPGTEGFLGQDLLLKGARAAGFFAYRAGNYHLNRVEVQGSLADGFHNTNGSYNGTFTDCISRGTGDDGWAMVQYGDSVSSTPHDFVVTRFQMLGNSHGRGFGIVNSDGLTVYGPTLIQDTSAAGILIARETQYGGLAHPVRDIRFLGETRLVRANHNREDHGALLIDNPDAAQPVEGIFMENVVAVDTGLNRETMPSANIQVKGGGRISAELRDFRFVGTGPASLFGGGRTADSVVTLAGWSPSDGYQAG